MLCLTYIPLHIDFIKCRTIEVVGARKICFQFMSSLTREWLHASFALLHEIFDSLHEALSLLHEAFASLLEISNSLYTFLPLKTQIAHTKKLSAKADSSC